MGCSDMLLHVGESRGIPNTLLERKMDPDRPQPAVVRQQPDNATVLDHVGEAPRHRVEQALVVRRRFRECLRRLPERSKALLELVHSLGRGVRHEGTLLKQPKSTMSTPRAHDTS